MSAAEYLVGPIPQPRTARDKIREVLQHVSDNPQDWGEGTVEEIYKVVVDEALDRVSELMKKLGALQVAIEDDIKARTSDGLPSIALASEGSFDYLQRQKQAEDKTIADNMRAAWNEKGDRP